MRPGLTAIALLITVSTAGAVTFTVSDQGVWSPTSAVVALNEAVQVNGTAQPIFIIGVSGQRSPGDPVLYNAVTPYSTTAKYPGSICWNQAAVGGAWRCATLTIAP